MSATPIVTVPISIQLANGTTADAIQVMADLNQIANQTNTNGVNINDLPSLVNNIISTTSSLCGKNVVVNGDSSISQVNGGGLITPLSSSFPIDMVGIQSTQPNRLQTQQLGIAALGNIGATAALSVSVLASYSPAATDAFQTFRSIEGFNFSRFQYGNPTAKTGSLQFKAVASVSGTYSGSISNYLGTRSYPFIYTLVAGVQTLIQIPNIPGDTGGLWVINSNSSAASINFDMGSGTNFKSTSGTWQTGNYLGVTGSTNLVSQVNGSTLIISDVQFEVSSLCTQFERKLFDQNLRECQRYLEMSYDYGTAPGATTQTGAFTAYLNSTAALFTNVSIMVSYKATKRASPTTTIYSIVTGATGKLRDVVGSADINSQVFFTGTNGFAADASPSITGNNVIHFACHWVSSAQI